MFRKVSPYGIEPIKIFYCFLAANLVAACFAPIQDCDETFNYWEPAHYLSHGYGLQTWEYSPEFAIRSWLYVGLHAIVANVRRLLPGTSKVRFHSTLPRRRYKEARSLTESITRSPNSILSDTSSPSHALSPRPCFSGPSA